MAEIFESFFIEDLPEKVRDRLALIEGELHLSEDLRGDLDMMDLIGALRRRGILKYHFHKPSEFAEQYARFSVRSARGDNEIQQLAIDLIARAYKIGASDIHIVDNGAYTRIKFRTLGSMCEDSQIEAETGRRMLATIYDVLGQSADTPAFSSQERLDGRIVKRDYLPEGVHSVRIHTEPIEVSQGQSGTGTFMALRLLYDSTRAQGTLTERMNALGFDPAPIATMDYLTRRTGLIVISGPTGHGKSTVLKHVMESMTEYMPGKTYHSVEDPPEYPLKGVHQIKVVTKEGHGDRRSRGDAYTDAIAGAMRSDPDVLMIGEIRYPEAAMAAIDAALTGHAVWATIHANNGFGIITRLESLLRAANIRDPLDMLCDPNVLAGLEYQRLIPKLCPHCKLAWRDLDDDRRRMAMPADVLVRLKRTLEDEEIYGESGHSGIFVRGDGCPQCSQHGFIGQTVAAEVIAVDQDILGALRNGNLPMAHKIWKDKGGKSYIDHALELIRTGLVDPVKAEERLGVPLNFSRLFDDKGAQS